jgi:PPP family 3-phenylpropionic acid transporter
MSLFAAPMWAAIADRFSLHRFVLPLTMLLSLPFALLFSGMHSFGQLFLGICLFSGCFSAITPLSDNAVLVNLNGRHTEYGRIRLWGSVGVGAMAWITGWLVQGRQLSFIFTIYVFFMGIASVVAINLPKTPQVYFQNYWQSAHQFIQDSRWRGFLLGCLLAGFSHLFLSYYLFIFARSLGAQDGMIGFLVAVASATNIVTYYLMPRILKRWSTLQVMIFSNGLLAVRCGLTAFMHAPSWVILTQVLDGPTWGTMWAAGVQHANEIAPRGLGTSAQAVYNAIFLGLGGIIGAGLGGVIYSIWGAVVLFLLAALMAVFSTLVFIQQTAVSVKDQRVLVRQ